MPWVALMVLFLSPLCTLSGVTVQRHLVYHQITGPTEPFSGIPGTPRLCANGNRVALTLPPSGTGNPATPNRIFVMNPDGTGLQQVDSYTSLVFSGSNLDISADGSKVVSTDSVQIRVCNGDGSGATPLIALDSNEINDLAISGDGTKVFFRIYRSTSIRNSNPVAPIQNGIYVINVDGTGLRQIVGPAHLSALLGLPADQFGFFGNGTHYSSLRSSNNGRRIVFSSHVNPGSGGVGQRLFGVNLDGSGLRDYFGQLDFLWQSTISADGSKVGYTLRPLGGSDDEVGTINYGGGGRRKLADSTQSLPSVGGSFYLSRLQLTADGSKLLVGSSGMLFETNGSGAVPLGLSSNLFSRLAADGLEQATMNSDATKFIYLVFSDGIGFNVMARLDVNPPALGGAPSLTNPAASPAFVYRGNVSGSTLSVQAASPVTEVGSRFILPGGLPSANFEPSSGALTDAGLRGDVAGDGIFSTNDLFAGSSATLGARVVRLKAELTDTNGRRHATAIDFTPLSIAVSPGLAVNDAGVTEGDSGTANLTFTVNLSPASTLTTTVNFGTANDTAISPADYGSVSGLLTFAPGETSKTITIPIVGDVLDEADERLFLNLFGPTNAVIADGQGIGTITDNDSPPVLAEVGINGAGQFVINFLSTPSAQFEVTKSLTLKAASFVPLSPPLIVTTDSNGIGLAVVPAAQKTEPEAFFRVEKR